MCSGAELRANNYFMDKVQQVYETMRVRHGFMLIGNPIGGKTVALRTLAKALGIMNDRVGRFKPMNVDDDGGGITVVQSTIL